MLSRHKCIIAVRPISSFESEATNQMPAIPLKEIACTLVILAGLTSCNKVSLNQTSVPLQTPTLDNTQTRHPSIPLRSINLMQDAAVGRTSVSWSPNSRLLATTGPIGEVAIWDIGSNEQRFIDMPFDDVCDLAWSPNGEWLGVASCQGSITILQAITASLVWEFRLRADRITGIAWSNDSSQLAVTAVGYSVTILDVQEQTEKYTFENFPILPALDWSHTQRTWLATGSIKITIWDSATGESVKQLSDNSNAHVSAVAWSPVEERLAAARTDGIILVWDIDQEQILQTLVEESRRLNDLDWSPDGTRLAVASDAREDAVHIWDVNTGTLVYTLNWPYSETNILSVDWSPDGKTIAAGDYYGGIEYWNLTP